MTSELQVGVYAGLFLAGLTGSLHCLGMCGPILLAFRQVGARGGPSGGWPVWVDTLGYHVGRIWTYGLLGLVAGAVGSELRAGAEIAGWQRPLALIAGFLVLVSGVAAYGLLPKLRFTSMLPGGCATTVGRYRWLGALAQARVPLLLGAVMGLIPCGLVYGMLVVAATLPTPWHSALAMIAFGAGTLPALTALVVGSRKLPRWLVARSPRLAAAMLVLAGLIMVARAAFVG